MAGTAGVSGRVPFVHRVAFAPRVAEGPPTGLLGQEQALSIVAADSLASTIGDSAHSPAAACWSRVAL